MKKFSEIRELLSENYFEKIKSLEKEHEIAVEKLIKIVNDKKTTEIQRKK